MAFATNLYFFVPFRRTVFFPVSILDVSQEIPCSIVHLSGTGGRAGGAVCFPNPLSLGLYNQALVFQIFLERTFPVQVDSFD